MNPLNVLPFDYLSSAVAIIDRNAGTCDCGKPLAQIILASKEEEDIGFTGQVYYCSCGAVWVLAFDIAEGELILDRLLASEAEEKTKEFLDDHRN
jgi:hypothetical protein